MSTLHCLPSFLTGLEKQQEAAISSSSREVKDKEYSLPSGLSHFDIISILERLEKFITNYDIWESRIKKELLSYINKINKVT